MQELLTKREAVALHDFMRNTYTLFDARRGFSDVLANLQELGLIEIDADDVIRVTDQGGDYIKRHGPDGKTRPE